MKGVRRAVIDVGTNSIKLLVADVQQREVLPIVEESTQTRLGKGFYLDHVLQAGPIAQTAKAVAGFVTKARQTGAEAIQVVATSAARDAKNQQELTSTIEQACGLPVRVITGEEEANYGFRGVTSDPRLAREPLLLLDVGGGSTEFIVGRGDENHFAQSYNVGTVRLLEELQLDDPPKRDQLRACRSKLLRLLENEIGPQLVPAIRKEAGRYSSAVGVQMVGTGGTASILGCIEAKLTSFDRDRLEATRLSLDRLTSHVEHLWSLALAERKHVVGLPPNRADVILTGSAIYEAIMIYLEVKEFRISTRGLRFALLIEPNRP